jgi:uncharacterized Rmd1/YagE family protein
MVTLFIKKFSNSQLEFTLIIVIQNTIILNLLKMYLNIRKFKYLLLYKKYMSLF